MKGATQQSLRASFRCAFRGLAQAWKTERNLRIHGVAIVCVLALAAVLRVGAPEWLTLLLATLFVVVAELLNTAIETIIDLIRPEEHPLAARAKNIAAAAVLVAACGAAVVGVVVFGPALWRAW